MKAWVGNPEVWTLEVIPWQFFCSLTFPGIKLANPSPRAQVIRVTMWFSLWRRLCRQFGVPDSFLLWAMREEAGEIGGRMHLHALIGGLRQTHVNMWTAKWLERQWRDLGGGHPDVRVYDSSLAGVEYFCKELVSAQVTEMNAYESRKFASRDQVMISKSCVRLLRSLDRRREREARRSAI